MFEFLKLCVEMCAASDGMIIDPDDGKSVFTYFSDFTNRWKGAAYKLQQLNAIFIRVLFSRFYKI